jgi:hypothetical protein
MSPNRTISSGASSSGRSRAIESYGHTTSSRSWLPSLTCEVGSASMGYPVLVASDAMAPACEAAIRPHTIRPRGAVARWAASSSSWSGSGSV